MIPKTIHGHQVLCYAGVGTDGVVLVRRNDSYYERYVTGRIPVGDAPVEEWFWGHYFLTFEDATRDFLRRLDDLIPARDTQTV